MPSKATEARTDQGLFIDGRRVYQKSGETEGEFVKKLRDILSEVNKR